MSFVVEPIASSLLSYFLEQYIDKIDKNKVKFAFKTGSLNLTDISIKSSALISHQIPFEVRKGIIGKIEVQIPHIINFDDTKFNLSDVFIIGTVRSDVTIETETFASTQGISELDAICAKENVQKEGFVGRTVTSLLEKLEGKLQNIHIRIEFQQDGKNVAFGVMIPLISFFANKDKSKTDVGVIRKELSINGLSIYMDMDSENIPILCEPVKEAEIVSDFKTKMLNQMSFNHQFILHDFSFSCVLEHFLNPSTQGKNRVTMKSPGIFFSISSLQYRGFLRFSEEKKKLNRVLYFAPLGRPDRIPRSVRSSAVWWNYANNCAQKKKYPFSFKIKRALLFLKNRKLKVGRLTEIILSPSREKYQKEIDQYCVDFGNDVFLSLASYAHRSHIMNKKVTELSVDVQAMKNMIVDQQNKYDLSSLKINLEITSLSTTMKDSAQSPISSMIIDNLMASVALFESSSNYSLGLNNIRIISHENTNQINILTMLPSQDKSCISGNVDINYKKNEGSIHLNITSPMIQVDPHFIENCQQFFKNDFQMQVIDNGIPTKEKRDSTMLEIEHFIESKRLLNVRIHMDSPKIIIPSSPRIITELGSLDIVSVKTDSPNRNDRQTFYDRYLLSITNICLKIGEDMVLSPFSTRMDLAYLFIPMISMENMVLSLDMDSVILSMKKHHYHTFLSVPEVFSTKNKGGDQPNIITKSSSSHKAIPVSDKTLGGVSLSLFFRLLRLNILNDCGSIDYHFMIQNMKSDLLFNSIGFRSGFSMQFMEILQHSNSIVFFSVGDRISNAIDIALSSENKNSTVSVSILQPEITIDLVSINRIIDYFSFPHKERAPVKETSESISLYETSKIIKPYVNEYELTLTLIISKPKLRSIVDRIDSSSLDVTFYLSSFKLEYLISSINHDARIIIDGFCAKLSGNRIVDPFGVDLKLCLLHEKRLDMTMKDLSMSLFLSDYRLLFELKDYYLNYYNSVFPQANKKELDGIPLQSEKLVIVYQLDSFNIKIVDDQRSLLLSINGFTFNTLLTQMISIKTIKCSKQTSTDDFLMVSADSDTKICIGDSFDILFADNSEFFISDSDLQWIYQIFMPQNLAKSLSYSKNNVIIDNNDRKNFHFLFTIAFMKTVFKFYSENSEFFVLNTTKMLISYEAKDKLPSKIICRITAPKFNSNDLADDHEFINTLNDNHEVFVEMYDKSISVNSNSLNIVYSQKYMLRFFSYLASLMPYDKTKPTGGPLTLPCFNYLVSIPELTLKLISNPSFILCNFSGFELRTNENSFIYEVFSPELVVNGSYISEEKFSHIMNMRLKIEMVCTNTVPEINPIYEKSLMDRFQYPNTFYLNSINVGVSLSMCSYEYSINNANDLLQVMKSFIGKSSQIPMFSWTLGFELSINQTSFIIQNRLKHQIELNGFQYIMNSEGHKLIIDSIKAYSSNSGSNLCFLDGSNKGYSALLFIMRPNNTEIVMKSPVITLCPKIGSDLYEVFKSCPFLSSNTSSTQSKDSKGSELSFMIESSVIEIPIDFPVTQYYIMHYCLDFRQSPNDSSINISNIVISYRSILKSEQASIFESQFISMIMKYQPTQLIEIISSPANIFLCSFDFGAAQMLLNKFNSEAQSITRNNNGNSRNNENINTSLNIKIGKINTDILFGNSRVISKGSPFIKFKLNYLDFHYDSNSSNHINIPTNSIEIFNDQTNQWDVIVEPTDIRIEYNKKDVNSFQPDTVDFVVSKPLCTNITYSSLRQINSFIQDVKQYIVNPLQNRTSFTYTIANETSECVLLKIYEKSISLSSHDVTIQEINSNDTITIEINQRIITLKINEISYPVFITTGILCFVRSQHNIRSLVISSVVLVSNETLSNMIFFGRDSNNNQYPVLIPAMSLYPFNLKLIASETFRIETEDHKLLFSDISISKIIGNNIPFIRQNGSPYVIIPINDEETSVIKIRITPNSIFVNHLSEVLNVQIYNNGQTRIIEPGAKYPFPLKKSDAFMIKAWPESFGVNSCPSFEKIGVQDGLLIPITLMKGNGRVIHMALEVKFDENNGLVMFSFFFPALLFNYSMYPILVTNSSRTPIVSLIKNQEEAKQEYWSDFCFFSEEGRSMKVIPFFVLSESSTAIECIGPDNNQMILLSTESNSSMFCPLHYTVSSLAEAPLSRVVSFYAGINLKNSLPYPITISPKSQTNNINRMKRYILESGSERQVFDCDPDFCFFVYFECEYSENPTEVFLQSPIHTTIALNTKQGIQLVELHAEYNSYGLFVIFNSASRSQPLVISNLLNFYIVAFQSMCRDSSFIIPSQSSSPFGFRKPFSSNNEIEILIGSVPICVDSHSIGIPQVVSDIDGTVYVIENRILQKGTKSIIVSKERLPLFNRIQFGLRIMISGLYFSFIDDHLFEVSMLSFSGLSFLLESTPELYSMKFSIQSIQLDDLHPLSVYDNVIRVFEKANKPSFMFACEMITNAPFFTAFKSIKFQVNPIYVFADRAFVSDIAFIVSELMSEIKPKPKSGIVQYEDYSPPSIFNSENFMIDNMVAIISFERKTRRPMQYPMSLHQLRFVPNISGASLVIEGFTLQGFESTPQYIKANILDPLYKQVLFRGSKLLLNLDIFFNIRGIADNVVRTIEEPSTPISDLIIGSPIRVGENVFVSASRLTRALLIETPGKQYEQTRIGMNQTASETFISGFKSLGNSLIDMTTGIITDPIKGAKKEGVPGFFKGVMGGLSGVVLKPLNGIIDAGTGIVAGTRKATESKSDVYHAIRKARAVINRKIDVYNQKSSALLYVIQNSDISEGTFKERIEILIHDDPSTNSFAFTQKSLYVCKPDMSISKRYPYSSITDYKAEGKKVMIQIKKQQYIIQTNDFQQSRMAIKYVESRRLLLKMGLFSN